jgi:DNA-directed RNA polymerase specialized sigma subunit
MVEKVSALDEAIKTLTEELGRKVSLEELAVYMGLTEEEIEDILRLTGEEAEEDTEE